MLNLISIILYFPNINSDGSISIPANDTPVLALTVPLTTGILPLNVTTLFSQLVLSYDCKTNDNTTFRCVKSNPLSVIRGHSNPINIVVGYGTTYVSPEFLYENNTIIGSYLWVRETINGSGDYEISFEGISTGAKPLTIRNISAKYRIFGIK